MPMQGSNRLSISPLIKAALLMRAEPSINSVQLGNGPLFQKHVTEALYKLAVDDPKGHHALTAYALGIPVTVIARMRGVNRRTIYRDIHQAIQQLETLLSPVPLIATGTAL